MEYTKETPLAEPIEIRMVDAFGNKMVLTASASDGLIHYSYGPAGGGVAHSLKNIGSRRTYPRKAVPGWQAEVVAFVKDSTEKIVEVR